MNPCSGTRRPRLTAFGGALIALAAATTAGRADDAGAVAPSKLYADFAAEEVLGIVRDVADLPVDARTMLDRYTRGNRPAEVGEPWSSGDIVGRGPSSQHLFSAVSPAFMAVALIEGGDVARVVLLLARRSSPAFQVCVFGPVNLTALTVPDFQAFVAARGPQVCKPAP